MRVVGGIVKKQVKGIARSGSSNWIHLLTRRGLDNWIDLSSLVCVCLCVCRGCQLIAFVFLLFSIFLVQLLLLLLIPKTKSAN